MQTNDAVLVALIILAVGLFALKSGLWARPQSGGCHQRKTAPAGAPLAGGGKAGAKPKPAAAKAAAKAVVKPAKAAPTAPAASAVGGAELEAWGSYTDPYEVDPYSRKGAAPAMDYDSFVSNLVIDERTRDNHSKWVEEMRPWAGGAVKIDDLSMEDYVDFHGLRRPQPVSQRNPLQLTEVDAGHLANNPRFNFQG